MTDIGGVSSSVPTRLGVGAFLDGGELVLDLTTSPEVLRHGVVRASVVSYLIDAVAGILVDDDPDCWSLTTDLSVRMRPVPDPGRLTARSTVLRRGRRSVTSRVEVLGPDGTEVATGAIGFAKLPRRPGDPPKPEITPADAVELFDGIPSLSTPLRDEAGIAVVDAGDGVVEVSVTDDLRNPAGTLQGAMVALVAEAAAEELVAARFDRRSVVCDLDLRYLAQAPEGPVRTRARLLGVGPDAPIEVDLVDTSAPRLTTVVYARCAPPGDGSPDDRGSQPVAR